MHPDQISHEPGRCPICGMDLERRSGTPEEMARLHARPAESTGHDGHDSQPQPSTHEGHDVPADSPTDDGHDTHDESMGSSSHDEHAAPMSSPSHEGHGSQEMAR